MKFIYPVDKSIQVVQKWGGNKNYYSQPPLNMLGHNGWDFACPVGTPVYACHDGKVWFAGIDGTLSRTIAIDSTDGKIRTYYAHLSEYAVLPGQQVKQGQQIGFSGNTGRFTTGPHLHFGVHHISNYSDTDINNGWNGACDPAPYFQGLTRNLFLGCTGEDVRVLQNFLGVSETGYYGPLTVKAVAAFQKSNNLSPAIGQCGPQTRGAINIKLK